MANIYNPASHSFNYKKFVPNNIQPVNVTFEIGGVDIVDFRNIQVLGFPNWATVYNILVEDIYNENTDSLEKKVTFSVNVIKTIAETFFPGPTTSTLYVQGEYKENVPGALWTPFYDGVGFPITLIVEDTDLLSITPNPMVFNWVIGQPLPASKLAQLVSISNWTLEADQSWVTLSLTSGVSNSAVSIGVLPEGLPVGDYQAILTLTNTILTRNAIVILSITDTDTEEDYLYIDRRNLEFISEFEEENTKEKTINLDVSGSWTATPSAAWLVISEESGSSGLHALTVTVDSDELAIGVYTGTITFQTGDIIKKVYVILRVLEFYTQGIESNTLYFADDRNTLEVAATAENTYLLLDTVAANGVDNITYEQEAPYLQGVANILIGLETNDLLKGFTPSNDLTSKIQNRIRPVNIGFTAFNINKTSNGVTQIEQFQNLYFLTGKTPVISNKLCYIPSNISVTNKAVLSLTVLATVAAPTSIVITGDISTTISGSIDNNLYVYNALVNLKGLGLEPGNAITITFGSLVVNVTIRKNEPEETIIAFENEWRELEIFNCLGFISKTPTANETTTEVAVDGKKLTKVVKIESGVDYTLATGFIYSQEEVDWLATILKARKKYIFENGAWVEIELTTNKLEVYRTRNYLKAYRLTFKRALI